MERISLVCCCAVDTFVSGERSARASYVTGDRRLAPFTPSITRDWRLTAMTATAVYEPDGRRVNNEFGWKTTVNARILRSGRRVDHTPSTKTMSRFRFFDTGESSAKRSWAARTRVLLAAPSFYDHKPNLTFSFLFQVEIGDRKSFRITTSQ